jgi:hypothetical protein
MGLVAFVERYVGDLDDLLSYTTSRTVRIRDKRLGAAYVLLTTAILAYILAYQVAVRQAFLKSGDVAALARLQLQRAGAAYRWPQGAAPYCAGSPAPGANASGGGGAPGVAAFYAFPSAGAYEYVGPGGGGVVAAQLDCLFFDESFAVPSPLESNAIFLTTRLTSWREQSAPAQTECDYQGLENCSWVAGARNTSYVADVELFTLLIEHSFAAPALGLSRTAAQMGGAIEGGADPCAAYAPYAAGCPGFVAVGVAGARDIVPIKALLNAAGIASLDQVAGTDPALANETLRYSGLVLLINIDYSNRFVDTGSWNTSDVRYTYRVSTVRNSEFKAQGAVTANNDVPSPTREIYDRHGIRIVVSFTAAVGAFDLQTLLVNLTVSLGLLSVAILLVDVCALNCCPLRRVYKSYKERATVDFTDLRRAYSSEEAAALIKRFETDDSLVDPPPPIFEGVSAIARERRAAAAAAAAERAGEGAGSAAALRLPLLGSGAAAPSPR